MSFVWYWTFWHWSKESFREGALLRTPLQGIGSHWDEWFRHEASSKDLESIAESGRTKANQRQFIAWVMRRWAREAQIDKRRTTLRFVLSQLAQVAPFREWLAFAAYRDGYGVGGVSAIVIAESSDGRADDVRTVEALSLRSSGGRGVVTEGFQLESGDLEVVRQTAASMLAGKGLWLMLALWLFGGKRPYSQWMSAMIGLGWLGVAGLILRLRFGPEVGESVFWQSAFLVSLWSILAAVSIASATTHCVFAWRQGRRWQARLDQSQIRLRMKGDLTVRGGSAGLPFCLNTLLSLYRTEPSCSSWIWRQVFRRMHEEGRAWSATGVIEANGRIKPVVVEPKISACLQRGEIKHLVTPRQREASAHSVSKLTAAITARRPTRTSTHGNAGELRLGFAAERRALVVHPCRHVAGALLAMGRLTSTGRWVVSACTIALSCVMVWAWPDLRGILLPPAPPALVVPASPSPYHLWVGLDTEHPQDFQVVLESRYWSNRRAHVTRFGGPNVAPRAELYLHRVARQETNDDDDGTIWIERRRHFLAREFAPGDRVGRYTASYLNRLANE